MRAFDVDEIDTLIHNVRVIIFLWREISMKEYLVLDKCDNYTTLFVWPFLFLDKREEKIE